MFLLFFYCYLGSNVTLEIFAEELKELWSPGILIDGITYRIGLVNGIWDGRGFEQVTKTQGGGSLAGCNACQFPGFRFANTSVYPFYSRYLPADDTRRFKRPLRVPNSSLMYNLEKEESEKPAERSYAEYIHNGTAFLNRADQRILAVDGVKGIWALHVLPYASHIWKTKDRMHCADHAVKDTINVLSKTTGSHTNRSEKYSVRTACEQYRIFPFLYAENKSLRAPWIVSHYVETTHDQKLKHVIGACSIEIPKRIWQKGHGDTSQETIMYAVDGWATWCLHSPENHPSKVYIECKLKLFDVLRILNSSRIKYTDLNSIKSLIVDVLVEHSALFPPNEQTYALHEIIHVATQIPKVGPPKFNNLFMFERVNCALKRMIKNKCNSMPSIVKAYAVSAPIYKLFCSMFLLCFPYVFSMFYLCFPNVFPMFFQCFFYVFTMFFQCFYNVFSMLFN
jgi:hypothetical protein